MNQNDSIVSYFRGFNINEPLPNQNEHLISTLLKKIGYNEPFEDWIDEFKKKFLALGSDAIKDYEAYFGLKDAKRLREMIETNQSNQADMLANRIKNDQSTKQLANEGKIYKPNTKMNFFKQFILKDGRKGGIRKLSLGTPNQKPEKVILIVGATGSGKTTFINSLANYILGVKLDDDFRFKIISQEDEKRESGTSTTSSSQTRFVSAYTFNEARDGINYRLTVVDTPGYGDTGGLEMDKQTTKFIGQWFKSPGQDGLDQLNWICLVVKNSENRLTAQTLYELHSVIALFGKDMKDRVIPIITFCDASEPPALEALKNANISFSKWFRFNNSAFFEFNHNQFTQMFWELGNKSFKIFLDDLEISKPCSLALSQKVLDRRERLENQALALMFQINENINHLETMKQDVEVLKNHEADVERNKNFKYKVEEATIKHRDIKGKGIHTTTCLNCNFTCHNNCEYADDKDKINCIAMNSGQCTACPKKCSWSIHKNLPYICEIVKEVKEKTSSELFRKYFNAQNKQQSVINLLKKLADEFKSKQIAIFENLQEINRCLNELKTIAMLPNHLTETQYIQQLIESEKLSQKPGWKQRVDHLNAQLKLALQIDKIRDEKYNPFENYENEGWIQYIYNKVNFKIL